MPTNQIQNIGASSFNHNELRGIIKARGYTNEQFAELIGIDPSTLSTILNGKSVFKANVMAKAAIVLGISDNEEFHRIFFSLKN